MLGGQPASRQGVVHALPTCTQAHRTLTHVAGFVQAVREGGLDVDVMARGEFDETVRPFIRGNGSVAQHRET